MKRKLKNGIDIVRVKFVAIVRIVVSDEFVLISDRGKDDHLHMDSVGNKFRLIDQVMTHWFKKSTQSAVNKIINHNGFSKN